MEILLVLAIAAAVVWWLVKRGSARPDGVERARSDRPSDLRPEDVRSQAQRQGRPVGRLATTTTPPPPRPAEPSQQTQPASRAGRVVGGGRTRTSSRPSGWVPLGTPVEVRGRALSGGVFIGSRMQAVSEWRGTEPALINPQLRTNDHEPDLSGSTMDYWPSYSDMAPSARAAYLDWLAAGRPGGAYVGYAFLFFYGIERRVLVDARRDTSAHAEVPALLAEVERLLSLYGGNGSFHGYASSFLAIARLIHQSGSVHDLQPPRERSGWQLPVEIQLAVGSMVEEGRPIPPEWAFSWLITHPEIWLRTPANRCPDEFEALFTLRYKQRYGEGIKVKRPKRRMTLAYNPASSSFGGRIELTAENLPDITELTAPTQKLTEIADEAIDELDRYSRYVGRHEDTTSLAAASLLPPDLLADLRLSAVDDLVDPITRRLESGTPITIATADLVEHWPNARGGRLSRREASSLASLLQTKGIGIEPDPRYGSTNFSHHEHAVLWRLAAEDAAPSGAFASASAILRLGVLLAQADGEVAGSEVQQLEQQIERSLHLEGQDRRRLHAHLLWLVSESLSFAGMRRHVADLTPQQRADIATLMLAVTAADGRLHRREMSALTRAYRLLELDPAAIHSDLHALAANDHEPVSVIGPDADLGDRSIPAPPVPSGTSPERIVLDRSRIDRVLASTEEVGAVLTAVFADDEQEETQVEEQPDDGTARGESVSGLDPAHSELVRSIATQPLWPRPDFEALANSLGLLPAGAVEAVNDAAFDLAGEPLLEGDDELEVNGHALKEMLDG